MKLLKKLTLGLMAFMMIATLSGCSSFEESGNEIVDAKEALELIKQDNVILIDANTSEGYLSKHVSGAINMARSELMISEPVPNTVADKATVEKVLSEKGISNDSTVIIYDSNNNMDAARIWWTLKLYGHENVKVISGGKTALVEAGAETDSDKVTLAATTYVANEMDITMIATLEEVENQVNDPDMNTTLIDTRSEEEFNAGTIPGSIWYEYLNNNNEDGTFKSITETQTSYLDLGLIPENPVILYCKSSVRGAETFVALVDAGFKNVKLYDGAILEWTLDESRPLQISEDVEVEVTQQDAS
jgi:thiosulfate/3-mercaptopyruvate sulfurtransferase